MSILKIFKELKPWQVLALAIGAHVAAFIIFHFTSAGNQSLSQMGIYIDYGKRIAAGQVPYRDFPLEYPPLAVPLFWFPTLFAQDASTYRVVFILEMFAFDLLGVNVALWALARFAQNISPTGVLLAQPLLLLAAGPVMLFERFDLAPAVLLLLAIVLHSARRERLAWVVLGLATALKIFPMVVAPLFLILEWQRLRRRQRAVNLVLFALAILLPTLIVTRGNLVSLSSFFDYHLQRGLEIESLYASLLLFGKLVGAINGSALARVSAHASEELAGSITLLVSSLALPFTAILLGGIYWLAWHTRQLANDEAKRFNSLLQFSALAVLGFMLAGKVLSPQYLLWLYPLVGVLLNWRARIWVTLGAAMLLTRWIYPDHWFDLMDFRPTAITNLMIRNITLVALSIIFLASQFESRETSAAPLRAATNKARL